MAVNLTTTSLVDYLKSIDGFKDTCISSTCYEKRKELYEQYCTELGYSSCADPSGQYYYQGYDWQNGNLLNFLKAQTPPIHSTFVTANTSNTSLGGISFNLFL